MFNTKLASMNCISFLCFFSFFLALCRITTLVRVTAQQDGVYIVYMGAVRDDIDQITSSMLNRRNRVYHRYTNGFLGFAARLSKEEAEAIAQRPGVVSVFPDRVLKLHTTRSWDFLQHQSGLEMSSSSDHSNITSLGEDTIIGFLDTGIWPESKSFSDHGVGPIPSKWKGKCIESHDFTLANCNRKLIGARYYDIVKSPSSSNSTRDHVGHGTHVAATAAGTPVPEATYHGLANGTARGGAPLSRIAMYRVCSAGGCLGSSILKAFDDAISDAVDIISISVGASADNAPDLAQDPIAIGAFHAVERGILVVSSAGNDGPYGQTVVNAAPWILTVAATTIDRHFESDVVLAGNRVIKGGGINYGTKIQQKPVYPLIHGLSAKNHNASVEAGRICAPGALEDSKVKGSIIVCEDFAAGYSPSAKLNRILDRQGGIGVVSVDDDGVVVAAVYGAYPVATVTSHDVDSIFAYMNSTWNPVATILPTLETTKSMPAPLVPYFSGRGPAFSMQNILKPDIGAPGVDILAAWPSSDKNHSFNILSGTSMSCPHVAGVAATVKSKYPQWGPSAIKSAIMTTAIQTNSQNSPIMTNLGQPATAYDFGAGEVSISGPLQPGLVYETETSDYLNFLCSVYSHNVALIKHISPGLPANFSCPSINKTGDLVSNMNYPSISVSDIEENESKNVTRTVTNVGEEDEVLYTAVTHAPEGLEIQVTPNKLQFTKEIKKLTYEATIRLTRPLRGEEIFGSITWTNEKYKVHSPVVASTRK